MSRSSKDTWPSLSDTLQSELKQSEILTNASRKENLAVALVSSGNTLGPMPWSLKRQEARKPPPLALLPPLGTQPKAQRLYFWGSKITADGDCSHEIKRNLLLGRKVLTNLDSIFKKQRHYFANKSPSSQGYGFPVVIWMWELDYKESWAPKNWCFWTVMLEKTFESLLDCKEIQPVHPRGDQSWVFIGRLDAEAETPVLWPPDVKNWLFGKDPDAGKDWRQEEKRMTEDEMAGWHHRLNMTWVWVNSGSFWWTGRPGVLRFMGS